MSEPLGRILEKTRHSLGKSLSDAEEETKIRARSLDALEQGDYDALPNPAYVRGYITAYAKFLGLDPAPLLDSFDREIGNAEEVRVRQRDTVVAPRSQTHQIPARTAFAVVAVLAVLVITVWGIGRLISGPDETPPVPVIPEPTATVDSNDDPATGPGISDDDTLPPDMDDLVEPDPMDGPFTVRIVVDEGSASWLRVTIDDLVAYEGTMAGGQSQEWTAEESALLRIGRGPAVTVYQNDVEVEVPSGDPPVLELPVEQ
jgi:cytoskeletal protein RodZ